MVQQNDLAANFIRAEEFRKYIEVEVLKIIKNSAEKGNVTQEKLQEIARRTLELIKPGMSIDELYRSAVKLDDNSLSELSPVVSKIMKEYEEKYEKKAIDEVSLLVRSGKYDEAQEMVKKVLQYRIVN